MIDRRAAKRYIWLHAGLIVAVALFPLYWYATQSLSIPILNGGCFLHDYLFLYCAFCGGTRSVGALLRFDVVSAMRYNALVPPLVLLGLVLDVFALVRLLRGEKRLLRLPKWSWIAAIAVLIAYAVLRNYLMIAHGYDPVGDLGRFWN